MNARRFAVALSLAALVLTGCASHLRVTTEVYVGQLPPDELPATVAEKASIVHNALVGYEEAVRNAGMTSYRGVITRLLREYPKFFGDEDMLREYESSMRAALENVIRPTHELAEQTRTLARQLGAPSSPQVVTFKDAANLEQGLVQLKHLLEETTTTGRQAVRALNTAEIQQYRQHLRDNFLLSIKETETVKGKRVETEVFPNDKLLAEKSGRKIDSAAARNAAIDELIASIQDAQMEPLERAFVLPPLNAASAVATTVVVPLEDKAIQMILTAPDDGRAWKKAVNDVVSWNWFGNSEIAFRMDSLGDSHIKGILFDPSETMKTGFNVFTKALEITASAYGANFPASTTTTTVATTTTAPTGGDTPTIATAAAAVSALAAPSKPAIDAEIARNAAKGSTRGEVMESAFRSIAAIGQALPETPVEGASGAAKKLLTIVQCAQTELADPQGRLCGGE